MRFYAIFSRGPAVLPDSALAVIRRHHAVVSVEHFITYRAMGHRHFHIFVGRLILDGLAFKGYITLASFDNVSPCILVPYFKTFHINKTSAVPDFLKERGADEFKFSPWLEKNGATKLVPPIYFDDFISFYHKLDFREAQVNCT